MSKNTTAATKTATNKTVVQVSCTVMKHRAKIGNMIFAKGKKLTRPADEVEALVKLGVVEAG